MKIYNNIIKNAKQRMSVNDYNEAKKFNNINLEHRDYVVSSGLLKKDDINKIYDKIIKLKSEGKELSAIGMLANDIIPHNTGEAERERYVFEIARLYRDIVAKTDK